MCRRLVPCSRNTSAYSLVPSAVPGWKKSAAMIPSARAARNSRQVGPARRGAGPVPAASRISRTVEAAIRCPSRANSPWDPSVPPPRVLLGRPQNKRLDRPSGGRASGASACGVIPPGSDEPAVPGEQGAWGDREDLAPASPGCQPGEGSAPEPVGRLVADRAGNLPAQDGVLVPQHEQLGVLRGVTAQRHRRDGQQPPGRPVRQRHDHADMIPGSNCITPTCADDFSSGTGSGDCPRRGRASSPHPRTG